MIRAFLFDLDGTLLDSEILWVEAVRRVLEEAGCPTTHEEALHIAYGHAWDHVYERFRGHCTRRAWTNQDIAAAVEAQFHRERAERDIRIPGSIDLLRRLADQYPIGIVSGSYRRDIARGIDYMGIADCVAFFVGGEDV
jgi:beta-phosphoglucomutase-like phosphatase (HAD superfamily)